MKTFHNNRSHNLTSYLERFGWKEVDENTPSDFSLYSDENIQSKVRVWPKPFWHMIDNLWIWHSLLRELKLEHLAPDTILDWDKKLLNKSDFKNDTVVCNFNDRLQNIPPSLIDRNHKKDFLNRIGDNKIGLYKEVDEAVVDTISGNTYTTYEYSDEKEMNGAEVFKGVLGSTESNESYLNLNDINSVKNVAI